MGTDWVFMVSDRRIGDKAFISPNYDESYVIKVTGAWVPAGDVEYLETVTIFAPCIGCRIKAFAPGRPTAKQVASMPANPPKAKEVVRQVVKKRKSTIEEDDVKVEKEIEDGNVLHC